MSGTRILGATALALGVAAPFAGTPASPRPARLDTEALARVIAAKQDHVSAVDLARWIRDRKAGLRVIDVREPAEFATFAIPTAENMPIEAVPRARFLPDETVVLYSDGGAHAAQAWVFLRAAGLTNVYFIAGGLADWLDDVVNPVLSATATPAEKARFAEAAELSRYFNGSPRIALPGEDVPGSARENSVDVAVSRIRRRGC